MDFAVGDVVELKSGGPRMTVSSVNAEKASIQVVWFNQEGAVYDRKLDHFPANCLKKIR